MSRFDQARDAMLRLDQGIHDLAEPYRDRPIMRVVGECGKLGDQPPMLLLSSAVLAGGMWAERPRVVAAGARMIAAHLLATAVKNLIKHRVDRSRPAPTDGEQAPEPTLGDNEDKAQTSFPSGHTAGAVAVARAFARAYPSHAGKALGAAGFIAVAQLTSRSHYLSDVLAGAAIGLGAEATLARVVPAWA